MDSKDLFPNLLKWLATFEAGANVTRPEDISDGVILAIILNQIEPVWFDSGWLGKMKTDAGDNWRLKVSNLRKVSQAITDYFSDSLEMNIGRSHQPDVNKLGEENSVEEACRLVQLVLGVAVNCSRKQEHIESIQRLEASVQAALMAAIQELMARPLDGSLESLLDVDRLRGLVTDLDVIREERDKVQQRCHDLDNQIVMLQNEKSVLQLENRQLQKQLEQMQEASDLSSSAGSCEQSQRYKLLRSKLTAAEHEIYKLEAVRDELRTKCETVEKRLGEAQSKSEELQKVAEESRGLKDELDILRETSSKVVQYEATLDTYKKRLQEMNELKRQIRLLEDKNTDYMQHNRELEEEVKRSGSYRPQMELYKKQVNELDKQLTEERQKRDRAEQELHKLTDRLTALQSEKERLTEERDHLKEVNEELKLAQLQLTGTPPPAPVGTLPRDSPRSTLSELSELDTLEHVPNDVRERLARLQQENRQLRSQVTDSREDQQAAYLAMLDDLKRRETSLQAENRRLNQCILELESRLEEETSSHVSSSGRLSELEQEIQEKSGRITQLEEKLAEQASRLETLQARLVQRDADVVEMEERYSRYLEKAKCVFRALEPKQPASAASRQSPETNSGPRDVGTLRQQLADKQRLVELLEREREMARSIHEAEGRLMTAAFFNLSRQGGRLLSSAPDPALPTSVPGETSFLARQRLLNTRRGPGNSEFYDF